MSGESNRGRIPEGYCRWLSSYFFVPGMDREDIAQEARVAAWLNPGHERHAAYCRIVDLLKMAKRKPELVELEDRHAGGDIIDLAEARERLRDVLRLPVGQRACTLAVAFGFSYAEVAAFRGVTTKTVDGALFEARKKLRAAA